MGYNKKEMIEALNQALVEVNKLDKKLSIPVLIIQYVCVEGAYRTDIHTT